MARCITHNQEYDPTVGEFCPVCAKGKEVDKNIDKSKEKNKDDLFKHTDMEEQ